MLLSRFARFSLIVLAGCVACASAAIAIEPAPAPPVVAPLATTALPATLTPAPTLTALTPATATPVLLPSPTVAAETTLLFTGDISPARCVYTIMKAAGDMTLAYQPLAEVLRAPDLTIGSLDATLSDYNPPGPCSEYYRNLLAPAETAAGIGWAGFDLITAATNHIKDCGLVRGCSHNQSFFDTRVNLAAAGVQAFGIGRDLAEATTPVIRVVHGTRFAFLGFTAVNEEVWAAENTPGAAPFVKDVFVDAVRRARRQADVVIVMPHWGREFTGEISWDQALGARALVEAGADLVVGNHPHHVQGLETFPNGAVAAYALGNFVFDEQWSDGTEYTVQGVLLRARFRGAALQSVDLIPIHIYDNFQPRLAPADEAERIRQAVADSLKTLPAASR